MELLVTHIIAQLQRNLIWSFLETPIISLETPGFSIIRNLFDGSSTISIFERARRNRGDIQRRKIKGTETILIGDVVDTVNEANPSQMP